MKPVYTIISKFYDLLDVIYFRDKGINPRNAILKFIPDEPVMILDVCCGTISNTITIARVKPKAKIVGIDRSDEMLKIAKKKIKKEHLKNITVENTDAANTRYPDESFDYLIIGLVLHEMETDLAGKILAEAHRLLKSNGKLIVLEWEKADSFWKRLIFFPIKVLEPAPFKRFFAMDKLSYFRENYFEVKEQRHCDYSVVFEMEKLAK